MLQIWKRLCTTLVVVTCFASVRLIAQDVQPTVVLFQNVRVFDGKSGVLSGPSNVLVRGNKIERISTAPIATDRSAKTQIIEGGGRTLMPGLIDAHWHAMLIRANPAQAITGDVGYNNIAAGVEATDTLMRGFTTVRDVGGPVFGLKSAIDSGLIAGPRIFPSGAFITVTSGHGDFRQLSELPRTIGTLSRMEQIGAMMVADSPDEVRLRVREQLMQGASQIKLTAGGGVPRLAPNKALRQDRRSAGALGSRRVGCASVGAGRAGGGNGTRRPARTDFAGNAYR